MAVSFSIGRTHLCLSFKLLEELDREFPLSSFHGLFAHSTQRFKPPTAGLHCGFQELKAHSALRGEH